MSKHLCYLTRIESFCASHRLHSHVLSDEENLLIYDKCNNLNGHGHNYKLEVTVCGFIDPKVGMVINISKLKDIIKEQVLDCLDHKNIDKDIEYFKINNIVSTTENLVVFIWNQLITKIPANLLHEVKLWETEKNFVVYHGEIN